MQSKKTVTSPPLGVYCIALTIKLENDQEFLRQMTRHHRMATMMAGMAESAILLTSLKRILQNPLTL
ncbi:MAG: hypothetical protein V7K86_23230 [Nostoc sp.]|uniref:hypothetical protein n=1 Tax=Nostoc sp. TaxID=1180 RepID=UPI002FFC4F57